MSLPFSDHFEPLVKSEDEFRCLLEALRRDATQSAAKYIEVRPIRRPMSETGFLQSRTFLFHTLDLGRDLNEIFSGLQKDCIQRNIQRAEREQLACAEGASGLLHQFYAFFVQSRRRQGIPPQPLAWFRNPIACVGPC